MFLSHAKKKAVNFPYHLWMLTTFCSPFHLYFTGDIQLVVVGNNNVGKSSLCVTFSTGQFPSLFTPMECNRVPHEKDITVGGTTVHVKCVDTEGHVSLCHYT